MKFNTDKLKKEFEENPALMIGLIGASGAAFGGFFKGLAQLMNANTNRKNSNTWKKEVNRRNKMSRR